MLILLPIYELFKLLNPKVRDKTVPCKIKQVRSGTSLRKNMLKKLSVYKKKKITG